MSPEVQSPDASSNPNKANQNAKPRRKSRKPPAAHEHPTPRLDTYSVNFCPQCGVPVEDFREMYPRVYDLFKQPVTFLPDVCIHCGLERREMLLHIMSSRKPTMQASDFMRQCQLAAKHARSLKTNATPRK